MPWKDKTGIFLTWWAEWNVLCCQQYLAKAGSLSVSILGCKFPHWHLIELLIYSIFQGKKKKKKVRWGQNLHQRIHKCYCRFYAHSFMIIHPLQCIHYNMDFFALVTLTLLLFQGNYNFNFFPTKTNNLLYNFPLYKVGSSSFSQNRNFIL